MGFFLETLFLAMRVGVSELQASPAPNPGYKGGKKKTRETHHFFISQVPNSSTGRPSPFQILKSPCLFYIKKK